MKYKYLTLKYAAINAAFMFLLCATAGYAYNFLSQSGFSDGTTGIIITLVSLCGLIGQTLSGSLIDRLPNLTEKKFISGAMIVTAALALLMTIAPQGSILLSASVILCFTAAAIGMPFFNSMAFIYEKDGQKINYGLGRGTGSAAYAIGSNVVGRLWGRFGKVVMPWYIIVFAIICLLLMQLMPQPSAAVEKETEAAEAAARKQSMSYGAFFRKYDKMILIAGAMIFLYFCHMMINTYMAKVVGNILGEGAAVAGEVERVQGNALFIAAMVELPTMFLFSFIIKKIPVNNLMIIAGIGMTVKHALTWLCPNEITLYIVCVIQMFAYAVLAPASVYFANENVAEEDRNKGQALMGVTATVGGLLASLVGGQLFQYMSVPVVFGIGVAASAVGTVLMFIGISRIKASKA